MLFQNETWYLLNGYSLLKPLSEILDVSINEILNGEYIENNELKEKTDINNSNFK